MTWVTDFLAKLPAFDPVNGDYDYRTAFRAGMGPTGDGTAENAGHWGSVGPVTSESRAQYNLPDDSYMFLKSYNHPTFYKGVEAEAARGAKTMWLGDRYYSVPQNYIPPSVPGVGRGLVSYEGYIP